MVLTSASFTLGSFIRSVLFSKKFDNLPLNILIFLLILENLNRKSNLYGQLRNENAEPFGLQFMKLAFPSHATVRGIDWNLNLKPLETTQMH